MNRDNIIFIHLEDYLHNVCFQVGQAVVDKACMSKCVCQASGVVNCEKLTCASGEETAVTVNSQHVTWVNGRKVSLPSKVTSDISVHISEKTVIIEKASAVRLTYSLSKEVNGKITTDVSVVGSWSAGDFSRW
ncbi:Zonadhesin [Dissostichus eleginoides]|uniref:Zonadhesin n=1 Tax=Dissostichus eleginoides TaxID=100907 RepID=A0AAD9F422_DISEL|nr:Zonadhesin [Dissostichus eleginoides]